MQEDKIKEKTAEEQNLQKNPTEEEIIPQAIILEEDNKPEQKSIAAG